MERRKVLNGTFEVALRILAILTTCKRAMTVERMTIYSYFTLYLSDYRSEETNIHPAIPNRNASYLNSKNVIMAALEMLLKKGLIESDVKTTALRFQATELGTLLYGQMDGVYKKKLVESIKRAHTLMKGKTDRSLNNYVYNNMAKWGSEFEYESVLKELGYAE